MVVVNLYLVVKHSLILSYFQCMMVEIASYLSSDDTSGYLTERPNTLVIVLSKSACDIDLFCIYSF